MIDDDPKLFYNRDNVCENQCLLSCSVIDVDEQCTVKRPIYGIPKSGRNSDHSTTWEEWSLNVLQKEKGKLIINADQIKTCYSFLYRIIF